MTGGLPSGTTSRPGSSRTRRRVRRGSAARGRRRNAVSGRRTGFTTPTSRHNATTCRRRVSLRCVFTNGAVPAGLPGRRAFGDEDRRCGQDSGRRELQVHLGRAAAAQPPIALERDHRLELHLVRGAKPPPFLWCLRSGFSCCRRAGITRGDFVRVGKEEALFTNHYVLCRARFTCRDSSARRGQRRGPRAASCRWCCAPRRRSAAH